MKASLIRVAALARNTFREAIRDKILYSLLFFAILMILSALVLGQLSLHEERRLIRDVGIGGISLFAVLIAIFAGVSLLYKELERKTVFTIIPKPLHRFEFVLGKFLGMALVLLVLVLIMSTVMCIVGLIGGSSPDGALVRAITMLYVEGIVVTAVAVLFSSFSTPFLSGMFTLGIFILGRSTPELRQIAPKLGVAQPIVKGITAMLPDLHLLSISGSMADGRLVSVHGDFVDWSYVAVSSVYGLGYAALLLGLACFLFSRRDFV